jgi:hypothetical protein
MIQDQASGAAANNWGRETARLIAEALGTNMLSREGNECYVDGRRAVIKCAAARTKDVGVSFQMLVRLDVVIGAFQIDGRRFQLYELSPKQYEKHMRDTASRGASRGKVGMVKRATFEQFGKNKGVIKVPRHRKS